ncbi:glycosyltransferase family 2 protein [Ruminococcus sp. OM05-10BH]|nr:glycosyltransferase family 2 protein [Ruminococcus sp. OM05-10BH]
MKRKELKVEVLVATMDQKDDSLVKKMNIQTDAIIGNQCDFNRIEKKMVDGHQITYLSFSEKGVGLNRNNTLMRSTGDILLFADDDMRYLDGYEKVLVDNFQKYPQADVLVFNIKEKPILRSVIKKPYRVRWNNFMRFGAVRIAVRAESIKRNGIYFNLCFGGGTEHSHGEDTLFLAECLRKKLKIYAVPCYIAELKDERESTWFRGYNNKYFRDKGILYYTISRPLSKILCLQDAIRHEKIYKTPWQATYKIMSRGIKEYKEK